MSNHIASLDDPLLTSALLPVGALLQPSALRWTLCATDRCFTSRAATTFFRAAKVSCSQRDYDRENAASSEVAKVDCSLRAKTGWVMGTTGLLSSNQAL